MAEHREETAENAGQAPPAPLAVYLNEMAERVAEAVPGTRTALDLSADLHAMGARILLEARRAVPGVPAIAIDHVRTEAAARIFEAANILEAAPGTDTHDVAANLRAIAERVTEAAPPPRPGLFGDITFHRGDVVSSGGGTFETKRDESFGIFRAMTGFRRRVTPTPQQEPSEGDVAAMQDIDRIIARLDAGIAEERKEMGALLARLRAPPVIA
jgi:hypothetical protein